MVSAPEVLFRFRRHLPNGVVVAHTWARRGKARFLEVAGDAVAAILADAADDPEEAVQIEAIGERAEAVAEIDGAVIDPDIHRVHWLSYEAMRAESARMRSPLVLASVERHRRGICYPLELIFTR